MSLATQISALASRVATEFKTVRTELASGLAGKASTSHTHTKSQVTDFAHASTHASGGSDAITIAQSQVTNLTSDLAGKAATSHTHTLSQITDYVNPNSNMDGGNATTNYGGTLTVSGGNASGV